MSKRLLALIATIAFIGVSILFGPSAANAAPKHLSAPAAQSGVKWTSVDKAAPKHLAAPSTALTKGKSCSANDGGYRVDIKVDYVVVSGKVDINKLNSTYYHRTLGAWNISDWASSSTDDLINAGNLWGTITRNPGAKNDWYTASPAFTPNGLKIGVRKASGSGTSLPAAGCFVVLP